MDFCLRQRKCLGVEEERGQNQGKFKMLAIRRVAKAILEHTSGETALSEIYRGEIGRGSIRNS